MNRLAAPNRDDRRPLPETAVSIRQKSVGKVRGAVREPIHAPLTPSASNTSGPTQHIDAPIAESIPPTRSPFPFRALVCFRSDIFLSTNLRSVPQYGVKHENLKSSAVGTPTCRGSAFVSRLRRAAVWCLTFRSFVVLGLWEVTLGKGFLESCNSLFVEIRTRDFQ